MARALGQEKSESAFDVTLRRSARAKRFSLRVSRLDGRVTLTLPSRARESEARAFLAKNADWLRRTLASMPESAQIPVGAGTLLPLEGRMLRLTPAPIRKITLEGDLLLVPQAAPPPVWPPF